MATMWPKRVGSVVMDETHILSKEFLYKDICEMFEEVMEGNKKDGFRRQLVRAFHRNK